MGAPLPRGTSGGIVGRMVWVILAAVGVPLWLCAAGILTLVLRNRSLRKRGGDLPVRLRSAGGGRWRRGHALWVHDVLCFRASPAGWKEELLWVDDIVVRPATAEDGLHRLGANPVVARLTIHDGEPIEVAVSEEDAPRVHHPLSRNGRQTPSERFAPAS
jgi:hypothetical protein